MQAQQLQQAMSGGLPQLPAPNMAGMAGGGIVAFQEGGRPEDKFLFTDEFGNPVYESDLARTMNAEAVDDTPEGAERRAQYEALQREGVNLRDLAQTPARQESKDRTSAPSTTYGTGDRTGQGENLKGIAEGIASLVGDSVRGAVPSMSGMSEEELTALTTSEGDGAEPRSERPSRMAALKETLGRDLAFLAPTQGYGVRPEPRNIFARGDSEGGEDESLLDRAKVGLASLLRGVTPASSEVSQAEEETTASAAAPTAAPAVTPAATTQAPATPRNRISEEEAIAAMSPSGPQTAAEYLMEYGQAPEAQPQAGESASDRAARMRRLIAGLRGFGAQGLGGFAAGSAEEELRAEQEQIADKERQRRAAMETRGLDLEERNITLQDALRRDQLAQQQRADNEMLQYRYDQLNQQQQAAVDDAVNAETAMLRQAIQALDSQIPNLKDGFFSSDLSDAVAQREALAQQLLAARARIIEMYSGTQYGPAQSGTAGLAPEDDALVSEYLNR